MGKRNDVWTLSPPPSVCAGGSLLSCNKDFCLLAECRKFIFPAPWTRTWTLVTSFQYQGDSLCGDPTQSALPPVQQQQTDKQTHPGSNQRCLPRTCGLGSSRGAGGERLPFCWLLPALIFFKFFGKNLGGWSTGGAKPEFLIFSPCS